MEEDAVLLGVRVPVRVLLGERVSLDVRDALMEAVRDCVAPCERVELELPVGVDDGVTVSVAVALAVCDCDAEAVSVTDGVALWLAVAVLVEEMLGVCVLADDRVPDIVGDRERVPDAVHVSDGVSEEVIDVEAEADCDAVLEGLAEDDRDPVRLGVRVCDRVGVDSWLPVGVSEALRVRVGDCDSVETWLGVAAWEAVPLVDTEAVALRLGEALVDGDPLPLVVCVREGVLACVPVSERLDKKLDDCEADGDGEGVSDAVMVCERVCDPVRCCDGDSVELCVEVPVLERVAVDVVDFVDVTLVV